MFNSFKNIFKNTYVKVESPNDEYKVACTALLCEAASMDGVFDENEKKLILVLIQKQFNVDANEANKIYIEGKNLAENSSQLYGFTRIIKESWEIEKRITLLEMLWELAYVDGELDAAEDMLIRRIAGLIHVEDRDRIEAKQKVLNKINN
ncbi:MAG: TerB family tellurite resistance protein [Alphaproteobacteria bacterium]|nr:TerB family tellurite resistance protein [Alphaproteobacteria bacterium]